MPALYERPAVYKLDTIKGYTINPITGDSIKPLLNSLGKIVRTGVSYTIAGKQVEEREFNNPEIINDKSIEKSTVETNSHPLQGKLEIVPAQPRELSSVALSPNADSIIVDQSNHILFLHEKIDVTSKKIALHEPKPVKIQPMRYKDNALLDIQYLDISQGLAFSYIYAMCQDKKGNLWLGTDYGLCKYDGTYLTTYTEKEGLINNKVNSIAEDKQGRLWIGTYGGVTVFDGNSFLQFADKDGLLAGLTGNIKQDSNGNMWITVETVGMVGYNGDTFIFYRTKSNLGEKVAPGFFVDDKGLCWFLTPKGLIRHKENRFTYFAPGSHILDGIVTAVEDNNGNTWFFSMTHGITKYDGNYFTHYTKENGLSDNPIMSIMVDRNDNLWIGTRYEGLNKFDGNNFTTYNSEYGMPEDKMSCTIEDKQGNIWVGTMGGGVCKLNDNGFTEKIPLGKLNNSRVRPIIKDNLGHLWLGTEGGGLYSYDGVNLVKHIDRNIDNIHGFRSALVDKQNNLWFGEHEGAGFYKYDYKKFRYYISPSKTSSNLSLFEDRNGIIWIGTTREGVVAFNGSSSIYYNESTGFPSNKVFVTKQDKKGNLWFGTEGGGLIKFDGKVFAVFSEKEGLFSNSITSIVEDKEGNLWLGTLETGLCKFDGNNFTYYTQKQGLAFNTIWSLKEDAGGQIWVGTDNGLSVLIPQKDTTGSNKKNYAIHSFGLQDGLKSTDFNLNGVCIDNTNRIWWGTGKAIITRDLTIPFASDKPQSLKLSYIEVNDEFVDYRHEADSTKENTSYSNIQPFQNYPQYLTLPYNQNHLTFYFSAIDWNAPHKIKYSYRLLGLDDKWSILSSETHADFRNLFHGDYELQVMAIGESNEWTDALIYKFSIRPAWWQTWWFKIIAAVLTLFTVFVMVRFIYLYRLRKQKASLEKQLAVQLERQRISAEMHDDIGAGLSGVRLLTELTKNKISDGEAAGDMEKIYQSVGDISSRMKEVIWSLNAENDSLNNLVHFIVKQVKAQLEHYPAELKINLPSFIPAIPLSGEARRNIFLAVKEAANNIIKHSGATKVELEITCDEQMKISIADNGKGVNSDAINDTGNGLKNMRQRMKALGGIMEIKNNNGFIIRFVIPLTKEL